MIIRERLNERINAFLINAENRLYRKISSLDMQGFVTKERLTLEQALLCDKRKFTEGEKWGNRWEYAWFFTTVKIPAGYEGKRIVFKADLGESLVFVNKKAAGALDKEHVEITLTTDAKEGMSFDIAMEVYAGHGEDIVARYDLPDDAYSYPPDNVPRKTFSGSNFGVFNDDVFSALMDVRTIADLRQDMDPDSLRALTIDKGLRKYFNTVVLGADDEGFVKSVKDAEKYMKPLLEAKNGSTAPIMSAIGHSHLDLEWLWTINETRRKTARTLSNQLKMLEEYDEYIYLQSQPWILETVKNEYPELYERVKKAVADGRIIVEGGMWVEADGNLPSGESLVRQIIEGKKFIKDEFGKNSEILWLPDIFGCSAAIPQIMKGCGLKYFYNSKMPWAYNNKVPFPKGTFNWRGIDGTEVTACVFKGYASSLRPGAARYDFNDISNMEQVPDVIYPFGHGDGGGGATRVHMEYALREKDLEGAPKIEIKSPVEFFENAIENYDIEHVYEGEIWYGEHKGSYTSQARIKMLNRRCEFALREAEIWATLLISDPDKLKTATEKLHLCGKEVLFNQFHDIIPGTAIKEVCERAEESYKKVLADCKEILSGVFADIVSDDEYISVFNSLPWERFEIIELPAGYNGIADENGTKFPAYDLNGKIVAQVNVPSYAKASYRLLKDGKPVASSTSSDDFVLENDYIKAEFNSNGELIVLYDKRLGADCIKAPSNVFKVYNDHTVFFDAWDINHSYKECEINPEFETKIEFVAKNDLVSIIKIEKKFLSSVITQNVSLRHDSSVLEFETEVDWQETHKLLKVDFAANIHTNELLSEIQFGYINRPTHQNFKTDAAQFEKFQHKWSALCENGRGFALLNDSKYGISAENGVMSLTLLKAAMAPMIDSDKGIQKFTYAAYPFAESFDKCDVVKKAYELNLKCPVVNGKTDNFGYFEGTADNVVLETVKPAQDGSGDIILRLYESKNTFTKYGLRMNLPIKEVILTDMLENNIKNLEIKDNRVDFDIKGFEVITLRLKK